MSSESVILAGQDRPCWAGRALLGNTGLAGQAGPCWADRHTGRHAEQCAPVASPASLHTQTKPLHPHFHPHPTSLPTTHVCACMPADVQFKSLRVDKESEQQGLDMSQVGVGGQPPLCTRPCTRLCCCARSCPPRAVCPLLCAGLPPAVAACPPLLPAAFDCRLLAAATPPHHTTPHHTPPHCCRALARACAATASHACPAAPSEGPPAARRATCRHLSSSWRLCTEENCEADCLHTVSHVD